MEFSTPKEARKTGQSITLAKVSLAKVSLWPKCHWPNCHSGQSVTGQSVTSQSDTGQTVSLAKVSLAKVSLAKMSLWPKCHSGQSVPAKVSLAKVSFWPKCDSALLSEQGQGYYSTGWFNLEMRSRAVFWFCQQTISKVDFKYITFLYRPSWFIWILLYLSQNLDIPLKMM